MAEVTSSGRDVYFRDGCSQILSCEHNFCSTENAMQDQQTESQQAGFTGSDN